MITRLLPLLVTLLIFNTILYSQGEANHWYFGQNAGVDFNTTPPSALTNGRLSTNEGCSSISDANGNLLFYSDGRTVWNRQHEVMSNANYFGGTGLFGDPSSTTSALIVPKPEDPNLYYIFTVDEPHQNNAYAYPNKGPANMDGTPILNSTYPDTFESIPETDDGFNNGFNYSVVDMRLNGGLGDVVPTQKNLPLLTYNPTDTAQIKYKCSEKITAVRADDCNSFWVISHFIDSFYAFKIDATGVDTNPVISTIGPAVTLENYRRAALGYLKASPDGKKLLVAHNTFSFNQLSISDEEPGGIYLHDFNDITGRVTSTLTLSDTVNPYSVEFSAETKKIYASVQEQTTETRISKILQWDLESTDIPNSATTIFQNLQNNIFIGALQLASNGKIYISSFGNSVLAVINNPEAKGSAVNYTQDIANGAIDLGRRQATLGLPPFIQSIFSKTIGIIDTQDATLSSLAICEGDSYRLTYDDIPNATYTWFKDQTVLPNTDHFIDITDPGAYQLEVDLNNGNCPLRGIANITKESLPVLLPSTLTQCVPRDTTETIFDLSKAISDLTKDQKDLRVTFYPTFVDAETNQNQLLSDFYPTSNTTERLYAKIRNTHTQCSNITTLDLQTNNTTINDVLLESCDDSNNDGIAPFELTDALNQILEGVPTSNLVISYYLNVADALLDKNALTDTNITNATPITNAYYARAADSDNNCYAISEIKLQVHPAPVLEAHATRFYCTDADQPITLSVGALDQPIDHYTFSWLPSGESTYEIQTKEVVTHTVLVTDKTTLCQNTRTITITPSEAPVITNVIIEGFSKNTKSTIVTIGSGLYEYAIDDPNGSYQDSPIFYNLEIGNHIAYARDKNGCGDALERIFPVLGFPEFFSPNNDGHNDFWQVKGFQEIDDRNAIIHIFDRYGKLLKTLAPNSKGWDGTYNNLPLPQNDYWVRVVLSSGIVLNAHFSLLR